MAFQHRSPRLDLSFPLEFTAEGVTSNGHCLNISESGLLALFGQALDLWTVGDLLLRFGQGRHKIQARVARVNDREAGLTFVFKGDADRQAIRIIVAFAAEKTQLTGLPPF